MWRPRPTQYELHKTVYRRQISVATAAAIGMLATVAIAVPPAAPAPRSGLVKGTISASLNVIGCPVPIPPRPFEIPDPEAWGDLKPLWSYPAGTGGWVQTVCPLRPVSAGASAAISERLLPQSESPPRLLKADVSTYPAEALAFECEGRVEVHVTVDENGLVVGTRIAKSTAGRLLDEAALRAARKLLFTPAMQGHLPVSTSLIVPFEFRLN